MRNFKILFTLSIVAFFPFLQRGAGGEVFAQDFLGYSSSNYAGVSGIDLNPASIADSRYKFDMTLIGVDLAAYNNYLGVKRKAFKDNFSAFNDPLFQNKYVVENMGSDRKSAFLNAQVVVPSFMITLSPKNAIAFTMRARSFLNADGVEEYLAHQLYTGIKDASTYKMEFENKNISIQSMGWIEYGATYSRVLMDDRHHFLEAGLRLKYLQGLWAAYAFMKEFRYNFESDTTATFITQANYGHTNSFSLDQNMVKNQVVSKPSVGMDLGIIYEWRPNREKFRYDMDGKTGLDMRYRNKYKLKAGFSVLDVGHIKFEQTTVGDFSANILHWDFSKVKMDPNKTPVENIDSILGKKVIINEGNQPFKMHLPTTVSMQLDYNIWNDFYANCTVYYAFQFSNSESKVHEITTVSLIPRWDWKWFGVFVPVSYNAYHSTRLGLSLRLGPLIVGTTSLAPLLGTEDVYGGDFNALVKIPIMYGRTKDRDKDKVSDKKDKCKDVPGTWEFMGCPDRDGDHVPDNKDDCPDTPGLPEFNGCPDRDGDKIIDKKDSCPDVAGLVEFNGCPDRDGDKIIDKLDSCPDEAGLPEYFGCPDTDHDKVIDKLDACPNDSGSVATHGCPDKDGDGILDKDDRCPDRAGPKENDGCPLAKLNLLDKNKNIIASASIDKNGKFMYPADLVVSDSALMQLESFDILVANEVTVVAGKSVRIARRGADGYFHFETLLTEKNKLGKLETPDVQIKLSKEQAQTIQHAMETLEFDLGKDLIRPSSTEGLDLVAQLLKQHTAWRLKLSGHTDNTSSLKFNMNLSKKRVESIKKYLVKKGVAADHIVLKWYGPTKPIATNNTEAGRQKNRRVEFLIIQ